MDPTTLLQEIRALVAQRLGLPDILAGIENFAGGGREPAHEAVAAELMDRARVREDLAGDLAQKVQDLDEWLAKGGFAPWGSLFTITEIERVASPSESALVAGLVGRLLKARVDAPDPAAWPAPEPELPDVHVVHVPDRVDGIYLFMNETDARAFAAVVGHDACVLWREVVNPSADHLIEAERGDDEVPPVNGSDRGSVAS